MSNTNNMQLKIQKNKDKSKNPPKNKNKKRAISGYLIFLRENYQKVRKELDKSNEGLNLFKEITKVFCINIGGDKKVPDIEVFKQISRNWRNLNNSKKLEYNKMAKDQNNLTK